MASFPFRYTLQNAGGRMNHEMESLAKSHPFSCFFSSTKAGGLWRWNAQQGRQDDCGRPWKLVNKDSSRPTSAYNVAKDEK